MTLEQNIIELMKKQKIAYEIFEHEPVYTNPAMAEALKDDVTEADEFKCIHELMEAVDGHVPMPERDVDKPFLMPVEDVFSITGRGTGNKKVNWKQAAAGAGTKKVSFAKPEAVSEAVGCEVGCVPPFGHLTELDIYMDPDLTKKNFVYFNPGVHDKSFKIKAWDLKKLCNPTFI